MSVSKDSEMNISRGPQALQSNEEVEINFQ